MSTAASTEKIVARVPGYAEAIWACVALRHDPAYGYGSLTAREADDGFEVLFISEQAQDAPESEITIEVLAADVPAQSVVNQIQHFQAELSIEECFHVQMIPNDEARQRWRIIRIDYSVTPAPA